MNGFYVRNPATILQNISVSSATLFKNDYGIFNHQLCQHPPEISRIFPNVGLQPQICHSLSNSAIPPRATTQFPQSDAPPHSALDSSSQSPPFACRSLRYLADVILRRYFNSNSLTKTTWKLVYVLSVHMSMYGRFQILLTYDFLLLCTFVCSCLLILLFTNIVYSLLLFTTIVYYCILLSSIVNILVMFTHAHS